MSVTLNPENSRLFIKSMRTYVLNPIQRAVEIASMDRSELVAEQDAFLEFIRRIAKLEPEPAIVCCQVPFSGNENRARRAREAYQGTVLAVDHYEEVYDEPLIENAAAELGTDAAEVLAADTGTTLTPVAKKLLIERARQRLETRRSAAASIITEQESLEAHQDMMQELVEGLAGTVVPEWHQEQFETTIATVLRKRQNYLNRRHGNRNGHELCCYLYADQNWRYPVLTSIARLRETTVA